MSDKRKQALVTYLAAIFCIAFVVVLISLVIQINRGNSANETTADKVLSLQTRVQDLQTENQNLNNTIKELQDTVLEIQEGTEYLEGVAYDATAKIEELEQTQQAYAYLVAAQNAYINADRETLIEATEELETLYNRLDPDALQAYYIIMEHMEEYYLGVE